MMKRILLSLAFLAVGLCFAAENAAKPETLAFSGKRNFDVCFHEAVDRAPFALDGFYWRKSGEPLWRYPAAVLNNE